jgi:hypothetical protein
MQTPETLLMRLNFPHALLSCFALKKTSRKFPWIYMLPWASLLLCLGFYIQVPIQVVKTQHLAVTFSWGKNSNNFFGL